MTDNRKANAVFSVPGLRQDIIDLAEESYNNGVHDGLMLAARAK